MFIAAGLHSMTKYLQESFNNNLNEILQKVCPAALISYGINTNKKKEYNKNIYNQQLQKEFDETVKPLKVHWVLDSGGYQVSIGNVSKDKLDEFIEGYLEFFQNNFDYVDEAFTLDLPITPQVFSNEDEAYQLNKKSYEVTAKLPQHIKDKMLFVTHFRTLLNFKVWTKLIYEDNLAEGFHRFSIGGLVVGQKDINKIPINLYTVGLLQVLLYVKQTNLRKIRFHILGASNFKSVIFFYLLKEAAKYYYNIDIEMSYDSANIFKKLMKARDFTYFDLASELADSVSIRSKDLKRYHPIFGITNEEIFFNELRHLASLIGKTIPDVPVYDIDTGSFTDVLKGYVILLEAYEQHKFDTFAQEKAKELFQLYLDNHEQFQDELIRVLTKINKAGKRSAPVVNLGHTYLKSLIAFEDFQDINDLYEYIKLYTMEREDLEESLVWQI